LVKELSAPVILGCDFLSKYGVILKFEQGVFHTKHTSQIEHPLLCIVVLDDEHPQAVPIPCNTAKLLHMPTNYHPAVFHVLPEHSTIFQQDLGHTTITDHITGTGESHPMKVLPRPHYIEHVYRTWRLAVAHGVPQLCMFPKAMVRYKYALIFCNSIGSLIKIHTLFPRLRALKKSLQNRFEKCRLEVSNE